jgi:hypothetical protein
MNCTIVISIIAIIVSVISLIISVYRLKVAKIAAKAAEQANKTAQGNLELSLRSDISTSRARFQDTAARLEEFMLNHPEKKDNVLQQCVISAIEDNLNAYEKGCALYIDNKIDTDRFFKDFRTEIRQLVENKNYEKYLHPTTSKFKAILKIYDEWENHEK